MRQQLKTINVAEVRQHKSEFKNFKTLVRRLGNIYVTQKVSSPSPPKKDRYIIETQTLVMTLFYMRNYLPKVKFLE